MGTGIMIFAVPPSFKLFSRRYLVTCCQFDMTLFKQQVKDLISLGDVKGVSIIDITIIGLQPWQEFCTFPCLLNCSHFFFIRGAIFIVDRNIPTLLKLTATWS
jgi:hypothetical protein